MPHATMREITISVHCDHIHEYQVFANVRGWGQPPRMDFTGTSPSTWSCKVFVDVGSTYRLKFFQSHPSDGHRFYESGLDHELHVNHDTYQANFHWRQDSENLFDGRLYDRYGNEIRSNEHTEKVDHLYMHIRVFPGNRKYQQFHSNLTVIVFMERWTSDGRVVTEKFQYEAGQHLGRYEVGGIRLNVNDEFWDVNQMKRLEVGFLLYDNDSQGNPTGELRGSRCRYAICDRAEGFFGVRVVQKGDDRNAGKGFFKGQLEVFNMPQRYCNFTRREGARHTIIHQIDSTNSTLYTSMYNINDEAITDALIRAHHRGVQIHILTSNKFSNREWYLNREYKRLVKEGIDITGVYHTGQFVTNHTKFAVFDGYRTITGSCNWEARACDSNCESLLVFEDKQIAEMYLCMHFAIAGRPPCSFPTNHPDSKVKIYYSRMRNLVRPLCREIDRAQHRIMAAVFVVRPMDWWENGKNFNLFNSLINAKKRGVDVTLILEVNTHDGGKYKDRTLPCDTMHHQLIHEGIKCHKLKCHFNNDPCAAMHHKFAVIDGYTTVTGSFNWWTPSLRSDDDMIVLRDHDLAQQHEGEAQRILQWYC